MCVYIYNIINLCYSFLDDQKNLQTINMTKIERSTINCCEKTALCNQFLAINYYDIGRSL